MQRSRKTIALVAAAAAGIGATTTAQAVTTNRPDVVKGVGYSHGRASFTLSAKEAIGSRGPSGVVNIVNPHFPTSNAQRDRSGNVVCARIDGDRALVGYKDRVPNGSVRYRQLYIEDHGSRDSGRGVDRLTEIRSSSTRPDKDCGVFPSRGAGTLIIVGDINVTDRANGA